MQRSMASRLGCALGVAFLILAGAWAGPALAQSQSVQGEPAGPVEARPPHSPPSGPTPLGSRAGDRGPLAFLLHIGLYSGFGGGVALGTADAGVRASVGWTPLLTVLMSGSDSELHFYGGLQISPDLYASLFSPRPTTRVGVQGGYRYNTLLGHGAALGGYAQFAVGGALDALLSAGLVVYPDGEDRLMRDEHLPAGTSFSFPGPTVNLGVSLGLVFFP
jgi:hypothetical protein